MQLHYRKQSYGTVNIDAYFVRCMILYLKTHTHSQHIHVYTSNDMWKCMGLFTIIYIDYDVMKTESVT